MKPTPHQNAQITPIIHGEETELTYSLEMVTEEIGVSRKTVLHYQELGLIRPTKNNQQFDTECLRQISRLEHLRQEHQLTDSAVMLVAELFNIIENLREQNRRHLR